METIKDHISQQDFDYMMKKLEEGDKLKQQNESLKDQLKISYQCIKELDNEIQNMEYDYQHGVNPFEYTRYY